MCNSPVIEERVGLWKRLADLGIETYVTLEPLMQFDLDELVGYIKRCKPKQVNLGRNTNRKIEIPEPTADEVKALVAELGKFSKVEIKKNARIWFK